MLARIDGLIIGRDLLRCMSPELAQAVWKLKKSKRDENDILGFDFKIEWACGVGSDSGLERITCSIAIKRLRLFTQPGPTASVAGIRTARKLSRVKLPSHRWSLSVEFDPSLPFGARLYLQSIRRVLWPFASFRCCAIVRSLSGMSRH